MPKRILLVEDDTVARQSLTYVLRAEKYDVHAFGTAEDAADDNLAALDIALLDVRLPAKSGDVFGKELAEHFPQARIVFITAEADLDYLRSMVPTALVFQKPLDVTVLLEVLKQL